MKNRTQIKVMAKENSLMHHFYKVIFHKVFTCNKTMNGLNLRGHVVERLESQKKSCGAGTELI